MKLSKKILCSVFAFVLLFSCILFAGCEISTDHLIKKYEGTYVYKSAVDTINNTAYDYEQGGKLKLYIRDGKAAFKNDNNGTIKYVYDLETSILGSSLKLLGDGYYCDGTEIERADYVFGSGNFEDDKLVIKLMFVEYAKGNDSTSLKAAITVTFERQ